MTYRERRLRQAERLREWAGKREDKAATLNAANEPYRGDVAFYTQPGRIIERERVHDRGARAYEHQNKASDFRSRADSIEAAADHAIYSDDPDAIERLRERIAELETKRSEIKTSNAAYRKEHPEIKGLTVWQKNQVMPHASWELENLSGNINRQKKRLAQLEAKGGGAA